MKKILFCFLFGCTMAASAGAQTYQELSDRALAAIEQDSLAQAEDYIRQALKLEPANPRNAFLFSNLGVIQRKQRRYEHALESYTFALNFAPHSVPILLNRAALNLELGRDDAARVDYSLALDKEKDNREALLMRAYIYMKMRDYKSARADYEHLLKLDPSSYNGRLGLATLEQKEGRLPEALSLLNRMIDEQSGQQTERTQLAVLYVARAGVEQEMQHPESALLDLEEAMRLDSSQAEAYLTRGQIYLSQGKKKQARQDFEKAVSLGVPQAELRELMRQCR